MLTTSTETLVRQYFTQLNTNRDLTAIDRYVSSSLYEHDPAVVTGSAALRTAYARRFAEAPQSTASAALFITEGDLSAVRYHYQSAASDLGQAVTEILRVRDGKIVERWTVSQPVPAHSANQNTMFWSSIVSVRQFRGSTTTGTGELRTILEAREPRKTRASGPTELEPTTSRSPSVQPTSSTDSCQSRP